LSVSLAVRLYRLRFTFAFTFDAEIELAMRPWRSLPQRWRGAAEFTRQDGLAKGGLGTTACGRW